MPDAAPDLAVREFLETRDCACPGCGYNLRGSSGTACPECNQPLVLTIALAEPRLGRFLALLIPLTLALGFFGIGFLLMLFAALRNGPLTGMGWDKAIVFLLVPSFIAATVALPVLLLIGRAGRRWVRARSARLSTILIALAVLLPALAVFGWVAAVNRWG